MSETATLALPISQETTTDVRSHGHVEAPIAQSIGFGAQRWKIGLVRGVGGVGLLVMGTFLLSQISSTPALVIQLAIIGAICLVSGLAFLTNSIANLFGRVVIDDNGIAVRPAFTGYSIAWKELERWEVRLDSDQPPEAHSVRFWTAGSLCAMFIPNGWLTNQDRMQIRRALHAYAGDKVRRPDSLRGQ